MYRTTVFTHRDRLGREYRRALAAGSLEHCCKAALAGPIGATVEKLDRSVLAGTCSFGSQRAIQVSASPEGSAALALLKSGDLSAAHVI